MFDTGLCLRENNIFTFLCIICGPDVRYLSVSSNESMSWNDFSNYIFIVTVIIMDLRVDGP